MNEGTGRSNPNAIQVIARAADILRLVSRESGLTLGDIAKRIGLPRSTIQRIIKALRDEDFVATGPNNVGIVLGNGLRRLMPPPDADIAAILKPLLEDLSAWVDDTVDLSTLSEDKAVFIEHIAGTHRLAALSAVGERFPVFSTANGKALLACLPHSQMLAVLDRQGPPADHGREALMAELDTVRATGLAFDLDEHTLGVSAIGTAFVDGIGQPYAISIPMPSPRFHEKRARLEVELRKCALAAARLIGGTLPPSSADSASTGRDRR